MSTPTVAQPTQPATQPQMTIAEQLAANTTKSAELTKGQEITLLIKSVSDWAPTTKGNLPRKMVVTNMGNFWMLASGIVNLPTSFTQPVQAKAVITQSGQYLNMNRLEFPGLEQTTVLAIRELPAGTALFSSAKDFKLAV